MGLDLGAHVGRDLRELAELLRAEVVWPEVGKGLALLLLLLRHRLLLLLEGELLLVEDLLLALVRCRLLLRGGGGAVGWEERVGVGKLSAAGVVAHRSLNFGEVERSASRPICGSLHLGDILLEVLVRNTRSSGYGGHQGTTWLARERPLGKVRW